MNTGRRWLVLTDGYLSVREAKTAHGVIRYAHDPVVAAIDGEHAGKTLLDVVPDLRRDAPIVASVEEGLAYEPTSLLLGVATPGGWIPDHWRAIVIDAIEAGLEIANGLHRFLREDRELVKLAREHGAKLWDVRDPPKDIPLFSGKPLHLPRRIVHTVGSDCAVGKMTVSLEIAAAGHERGVSTEFIATGQTGILIAGRGIAVDRVISDFVAGAAEKLIVETHPSDDVLVVEGQGSLWHPAYSAVTLGLLHGSCPHVMVLCHKAGHDRIDEPPHTELPPLTEMIEIYERTASTVRPATVAAIAVNCGTMSPEEADAEMSHIEKETGLPTGDVMRGDALKLWEAVEAALPEQTHHGHSG